AAERSDRGRAPRGRPPLEARPRAAARGGHRCPRPGLASRPVQRGDGGGARRARRRDRRLHVRAAQVGLAARRRRGAAEEGNGPPGRARRRRALLDGGAGIATYSHAEPVGHDEHEHHGPPVPHYSSRIKPETLGMYLFIASEIMLFGSFFTAYLLGELSAGATVAQAADEA